MTNSKTAPTIPSSKLRTQAFGLLTGLSLQFLLGMYAALFVQFPENAHEGQLWKFAWTQVPIAAHIIIGLGLLIGAIGLLIRSIKQKNKKWSITASIGAIAILIAIMSGARFIPTQQNILSYVMSIAFILAMLIYSWGIYTN